MDGGPQQPSPPANVKNEPRKRIPEGTDVNWVVHQVGWAIPTWVEDELYKDEFKSESGQRVLDMLNNCFSAIGKALATTAGDDDVITFKYWRKLSDKATKMKPVKLKASLFKHPQYDSMWMYVEYAD